MLNQKDIQTVLRYSAFDILPLGNRIQRLTSKVIGMEWKKKRISGKSQVKLISVTIKSY